MIDVYAPDGRRLGGSMTKVARALGVSRQALYNAADETWEGWRLRYMPSTMPSGRPRTTIRLWTGQEVRGWREAAALTGSSVTALRQRRRDAGGGVVEVLPPSGPGAARCPQCRGCGRFVAKDERCPYCKEL